MSQKQINKGNHSFDHKYQYYHSIIRNNLIQLNILSIAQQQQIMQGLFSEFIPPIEVTDSQIQQFDKEEREEVRTTTPTNTTVNILTQLLGKLTLQQNSGLKYKSQQTHSVSTDQRFRFLKLLIPDISNHDDDKKNRQIEIFMGKLCKQVFEHAFSELRKGELDGDKVKVYCSENILNSIIELIQKNNLSPDNVSTINRCLKDDILPYFGLKYPLSKSSGENTTLQRLIITSQNMDDEQNDLIFKSKVKFRIKSSGNYNTEIMKFMNFLIEETDTNQKQFQDQMANFFEMVYDEEKVMKMRQFDPKNPKRQPPPDPKKSQTQKNDLGLRSTQQIQNQSMQFANNKRKAEYQQKVKTYTSFLIGKKLPSSMKKFSKKQIQSGNLKLNNPALMRILTKWCQQLEKYYEPQTLLDRQKPYRMRDGTLNFFPKKCYTILLKQILKRESKWPKNYIQSVTNQSQIMQSQFARKQDVSHLHMFSVQESNVGSFAAAISIINQSYIIGYLNSLIHGIVVALQQFYSDLSLYKIEELDNIDKLDLQKLQEYCQLRGKDDLRVESYVPQLLTFKIGDLLRCKCSSKQKQITSLYRQIQKISFLEPQKLKIVRLKNRLNKPTKDIMLNMLYRGKMLIEMQLAINSQRSKFIENSKQFRHYLYQLQRSNLGPINQMCSIWANKDQRIVVYKNDLMKNNKRQIPTQQQQCGHTFPNKSSQYIYLPFRCQRCNYFYYNPLKQQKHQKCKSCSKQICFVCQLELMSEQNIRKTIKLKQNCGKIVRFDFNKNQNQLLEMIPKRGYIKYLKQLNKNPICFVKYSTFSHMYLLQKISDDKFEAIVSFNTQLKKKKNVSAMDVIEHKNSIRKNLIENIIIEDESLEQINQQQIKQSFILQSYLKNCDKTQKNSISLVGQNLTEQTFIKYYGNDKKSAKNYLTNLNLSQNKIKNLSKFTEIYPKLQQLIVNQNMVQEIPEVCKNWTHLKKLSLEDNKFECLDFHRIGDMKSLNQLCLPHNKIQQLKFGFKLNTKLKKLDLYSNQICVIPDQFSNLKVLQQLNIYDNHIKVLPETIGEMIQLKKIKVFNNQLKKLPQSIGLLTSLVQLDASHNLIDRLPETFGDMVSLAKLVLTDNNITCLPSSFTQLQKLTILNLYKNSIQALPQAINCLKSLTTINLSHNKLSKLPDSFGKLSNLIKVSLAHNSIKILPKNFVYLRKLRELNVSNNCLKSLSQNFGRLESLKQLRLNSNNLKQLPASLGHIRCLQQINLEKNKLINLPNTLGQLCQLRVLHLSKNQLYQLPSSLQNLSQLQTLDMQKNKFKQIPQVLYGLQELQALYVSNNNIQYIPDIFFKRKDLNFHIRDTPIDQTVKFKLEEMIEKGWDIDF